MIVAQDALLVETEPLSVELHRVAPVELASCMVSVPEPALEIVFWMLAASADDVGDMLKARSAELIAPAMTTGRMTPRRRAVEVLLVCILDPFGCAKPLPGHVPPPWVARKVAQGEAPNLTRGDRY